MNSEEVNNLLAPEDVRLQIDKNSGEIVTTCEDPGQHMLTTAITELIDGVQAQGHPHGARSP